MSKQKKKIVEVPVTSEEERQELSMCRMTFACLLMMVANGGQAEINNFLSDKTADEVREYAEIWDRCAADPVGAVFQRPAFELMANIKDMVNDGGAAKWKRSLKLWWQTIETRVSVVPSGWNLVLLPLSFWS